ncbi:unnamed protein product [Rotaria magnacalcarata]|uniref:Uncharacterized protein n=1 Tax=Rotaria magnacalcarata TaxID=392030 RepID=A0A816E9E6_9BILA|nr:unnamed protein product [Rotaria magnacalcarata]CAF1643121.1 unnamed protein product [Rotaria magnacalcarata]CAF2071166.1 unnamed protein product [Rotaria magnacalcarata]CAF2128135.1 unnamed protein product [Rotaria magnacalcarata]CAF2148996.1 unnamed protein product [Rotaria magnacalcarata]
MANASVYQNVQIQETIGHCKAYSRIDLRKQPITDSDIEIIIKEAIIKKQCSMLWLVSNRITSQGISNLAAALHKCTALEGLSLCDNAVNDTDVFHITSALSHYNTKLRRLALTSNNITDEGVQHLAEILKMNCSLTELWLGFNKITDRGVQILTDALAHYNKTLCVLSLSWNKLVTDSSVDFFIDMFENNQTLRTVCLTNCNLSESSKLKLRKATKLRREFYLDL